MFCTGTNIILVLGFIVPKYFFPPGEMASSSFFEKDTSSGRQHNIGEKPSVILYTYIEVLAFTVPKYFFPPRGIISMQGHVPAPLHSRSL